MADEESDFLPQLLAYLDAPALPGDFVESFWRRVAQEDDAGTADHLAADDVDNQDDPDHVRAISVVIVAPQPAMIRNDGQVSTVETASVACLSRVRTLAEAVVVASGGTAGEADLVGIGVIAYVDYNWASLRLNVLARDSGAWERHILRTAYRRWLGRLLEPGGRRGWSTHAPVVLARARTRALAESCHLVGEDRLLFNHVYYHGFSVAETAIMFGFDQGATIRRLRAVSTLVRATSSVMEVPDEVTHMPRAWDSPSGRGPVHGQESWPGGAVDDTNGCFDCYRASTSVWCDEFEQATSTVDPIGPKHLFSLGRWVRRGSSDNGSGRAYPRSAGRHCPGDERGQSQREAGRTESGENDPMSASTTMDPVADLLAERLADHLGEPVPADYRDLLATRLPEVHHLVVSAMVRRGYPLDAEDLAQDVMEKILAHPERFADLLSEFEANKGYFVTMGLNVYLMRMRAEKRRRQREERHGRLDFGSGDQSEFDDHVIHDLVAAAPLTPLQRAYVMAVFDEQLKVEDIAARTGTTPRAVRAVLQRAGGCIRH